MIVLYEVSQAKQAKEASTPEVSPRIRALESDRLPVLRACRHLSLLVKNCSVERLQVLLVLWVALIVRHLLLLKTIVVVNL